MKTSATCAAWNTPRVAFGLAVMLGLLVGLDAFGVLETLGPRAWPVLLMD